jgi:O-antigen biosynthesis protein WbqP
MINFLLKILAAFGLFLLSPIIILSLLLVFIEDGLPLFFMQDRLGRNKGVFKIYKIRTMYNNTPNLGTHDVSDLHYLKIGHFLRKLKIDELPQVINFIKGDINLIGPRPGLPNQNELTECRNKNNIFEIIPGISGLAQVLGYDMSNPSLLAKIDGLYIERKSVKLDLIIFIATFYKPYKEKLAVIFKNEILEYLQEEQL